MRLLALAVLSSLTLAGAVSPSSATILIRVDQSTQRMSVDVDGRHLYDWRVSTGKPGYDTPNGAFRVNRMDADHHSDEYENAPMPHAMFFDLNGHAIHGSFDSIGRPAASHGCVRVSPANAATLFKLVKTEGMANTKVEIEGDVRFALRDLKSLSTKKVARRKTRRTKDLDDQGELDSQPGGGTGTDVAAEPAPYDPRVRTYGAEAPDFAPAWR